MSSPSRYRQKGERASPFDGVYPGPVERTQDRFQARAVQESLVGSLFQHAPMDHPQLVVFPLRCRRTVTIDTCPLATYNLVVQSDAYTGIAQDKNSVPLGPLSGCGERPRPI